MMHLECRKNERLPCRRVPWGYAVGIDPLHHTPKTSELAEVGAIVPITSYGELVLLASLHAHHFQISTTIIMYM